MTSNSHPVQTQIAADNCEVLRARLAKYEDAEGNPISTIAEQVREGLSIQVCKLGRLGAAYDPADTRYAYTYAEQPDNAHAWRLGEAFSATKPGGDCIDAGLGLLKQLEKRGFGVFQLAAAPSAGSQGGDV